MLFPRSIIQTCTAIEQWHANLPPPHPPCFGCEDLTKGIGAAMRSLHLPLLVLGWERRLVWSRDSDTHRRILRVMWAPPGQAVPRPKRGRPPIDLTPILDALVGEDWRLRANPLTPQPSTALDEALAEFDDPPAALLSVPGDLP